MMNENNVLSFSNNDRHTLEYKLYVNVSLRAWRRIRRTFDFFLNKKYRNFNKFNTNQLFKAISKSKKLVNKIKILLKSKKI